MLELENVSKSFQGSVALNSVDLKVPTGSTHALIGTSGSGKTTLLRIMLGLIPLDKGFVKINGKPLSSFTRELWADQIGYVPQDGGLFPHMTVLENVTLIGKYRGFAKNKVNERIDQILSITEMDSKLLSKFPNQLSGGQKQRASIMRAIFLDPQILLFDEPMGALDPLVRKDLQHELKSIFQRLKKTVIVVTHDLGEAVYLADQITLLHQNKVIQTGSYQDFFHHPKDPFVSLFINAHRGLPEV
jgi:osmoprotectant transport system ATP-binding protein